MAAYLSNKVASISCIDVAGVPFERVLGERVGKMLQSVRSIPSPRQPPFIQAYQYHVDA